MINNKVKIFVAIVFMFVFALGGLFAMQNNVSAFAMALEPVDIFADFTSKSTILMHKDSGAVLYSKDPHKKVQVASISKLMTTLIVLEQVEAGALALNDMVLVSDYAAEMEGSQAFLDAGQQYTVQELLKTVIVASANDSAVVLAEAIGGSEQAFTKVMNERAKALGMTNTSYANSTGLSAPNQYSTAYDTTIILRELYNYSLFNEDCKIWMDKLVHKSGRETELVNTNRLIRYFPNTVNGKTGFTDEAGYCLATTAEKDGMTLIAVTLNTSSAANRFKESTQLYNYGFANYENKAVFEKDELLKETIKINSGKKEHLPLVAKNSFSVLNKRGDNNAFTLSFELNNNQNAPVAKGDVVGKCLIVKEGKVLGEVEILAAESIDKENYVDILKRIHGKWVISF